MDLLYPRVLYPALEGGSFIIHVNEIVQQLFCASYWDALGAQDSIGWRDYGVSMNAPLDNSSIVYL